MNTILDSLKELENPETLKDLLDFGKKKVQEFPLLSVGIASGIGFFIGLVGMKKAAQSLQTAANERLNNNFDPLGIFINALNVGLLHNEGKMDRSHETPQA